jgi:hypothetical protein
MCAIASQRKPLPFPIEGEKKHNRLSAFQNKKVTILRFFPFHFGQMWIRVATYSEGIQLKKSKIEIAFEEAKALLEMENIYLPQEIEMLLWKKAAGEINGEFFRKQVLQFVNEMK